MGPENESNANDLGLVHSSDAVSTRSWLCAARIAALASVDKSKTKNTIRYPHFVYKQHGEKTNGWGGVGLQNCRILIRLPLGVKRAKLDENRQATGRLNPVCYKPPRCEHVY